MTNSRDYWRMDDDELEKLATDLKLTVYQRAGAQGQFFGIDREKIIAQLLKRDAALQPIQATHSIHVEKMIGSAIQQGTTASSATVNFQANDSQLGDLIQNIKRAAPQIDLNPEGRTELEAEIKTIEAQLASPKPKAHIIRSCLESAKTLFEKVAGNVLAAGLIHEIVKYLGS